ERTNISAFLHRSIFQHFREKLFSPTAAAMNRRGVKRNFLSVPIAASGLRKHDGWAQLGGAEVGKREANYDDLPGCKWAHAASSSGRFQSSASAASLKSAASCANGASSKMVTSARRGDATCTGSIRRTSPLGSMIASTVLIFRQTLPCLGGLGKGQLGKPASPPM